MAANQNRNVKARHMKPMIPGLSDHPPGRAPSAPTSEQLLASLRNAIQTTNDIVADQRKCSNTNNIKSNGAVARLDAEPWRGVTGNSENQVIPPPGFFNDREEGLAIGRVPEGLAGDDVLLLPPPEGFDVDGAATEARSFGGECCDVGGPGRVVESGQLPGNGVVLPPPAVFDNGSNRDGLCFEDGDKNEVTLEKATENVEPVASDGETVEGLPGVTVATDSLALPDVTIVTDSVALPGVVVTTDSAAFPGVTVATDTVGGVDVKKRSDVVRRGEEEGKIIGGLFSVREICALIENDRMFVLQGVMDEESAERLQWKSASVSASTGILLQPKQVSPSSSTEKLEGKPVSLSSSTEKLELKPVSVISNIEKLEHKPVSVSTGMEPKPVSESSRLDGGEGGYDVRAEEKSAADVVTMETVTGYNGICRSDVKGPSSLKVMALHATSKLQVVGTDSLEREHGGTAPTFVEAHREGDTPAANGNLLSESKAVDDDLCVKSIPGIPTDGIPSNLNITTDAPKTPGGNHAASVSATGEPTPDVAASFDLNKTPAADLARLSTDPDMLSPDLDKTPPYPGVLDQSKTSDYDYPVVSLEAADVRVDRRNTTSEPVSFAINTGESRSEAGSAGAVQGASTTVERNPRPESIVTTHLWSDTAVARILNVNAGISTDLSKAGILSDSAVLEITPRVVSEEKGKLGCLEGKSSTGDGDDSTGRTASREKRKVEVVRLDVTESMEQTERERHFVSRTVKTTMTQETRSGAVGAPPRVGVVTNSGARPKTGSMFAVGGDLKIEDGFFDGKGSNDNTGLLGELRKNRPGMVEGLKETRGEQVIGGDTGGGISGKQSSAFDTLLDQRDLKTDRKSWSVYDRREASRQPGEASSCSPVESPLKGLTTFDLDASIRIPGTSSPTSVSPEARVSDVKEEVSVTKGSLPLGPAASSPSSGITESKQAVLITTESHPSPSRSSPSPAPPSRVTDHKDNVSATKERLPPIPTVSSPSPVLLSRTTERKEEVVRIPRPTSLMVRPGKPPRHSASHPSTPSTHQTVTETSHATTPSVSAPLATPEESFDDVPYSNRSRQSSVGPSRSRQSSVGPSRSRQSSISSLLGYQMAQSGVSTHFVVVAIDFGTTYSGYAFSFTRDPESIHMMRRWEGGDPGIVNQKTPTTLLLSPDGKFHSFGFAARDFYHDLDPQEAKKWMYFEKFKMTLHHNAELNKETTLKASNGKTYPALSVFSHALTFFKDHALQELSDQSSTTILNEDIRWVITVPAIWKAPAKQFMRQAAYQAGIASADNPNQLLIALEPEAASIYVRKLRLYQLMPDPLMTQLLSKREPTPDPLLNSREPNSDDEFAAVDSVKYKTLPSSASYRHSMSPSSTTASVGQEVEIEGTNYMVVDCGGGTVDITVYEMESGFGHLKELHKATGGPYGSLGIDMEFEKLLVGIFGSEFIEAFRTKRPAGWVDLLIAFESRKRTASPFKNNPLNVSLPFSFIDYYKKYKGSQVESAIRKYGNKEVAWSSQGMLRLTPTAMRRLFQPTLDHIKQAIGDVLNNPTTRDIKYMFLVGGFAESAILQMEMRKEFEHLLRILIPQDVGLTILKGAVCFGLDPTIVSVRRSRMTYGVGVLNRFVPDKHPRSKMITKDGAQWCTDVFDKFVEVDQSVAVGETVVRSYAPAKAGQKSTIIHIYSSEKPSPQYISDPGVKRCGTLCLDLTDVQYRHSQKPRRREIQARMTFGDTEVKVTALDVATGKCVRAAIDFMNK